MNTAYKIVYRGGKQHYQHRLVWQDNFGQIPDGFHVHHINGDKLDNRLENLELVSKADHHHHHSSEFAKTDVHRQRCRDMTKRLWDSKPLEKRVCENCGGEFFAKKSASRGFPRTCSQKCKSRLYYVERGQARHFAKKGQ